MCYSRLLWSCRNSFLSGHFGENYGKFVNPVWFSDLRQTDSSFLLWFSQFENDCSLVCTREMWDLHGRKVRFVLEKCEICTGEMWDLHWRNVRFARKKCEICTGEMWALHWRNVRFAREKCEICTGEMWDVHWKMWDLHGRNVTFAWEKCEVCTGEISMCEI